jgi:hypothetical protein
MINIIKKITNKIARRLSTKKSSYSRDLTREETDELKKHNLNGCVILTYTPKNLSNYFIWGKWKHIELISDFPIFMNF